MPLFPKNVLTVKRAVSVKQLLFPKERAHSLSASFNSNILISKIRPKGQAGTHIQKQDLNHKDESFK